MAGSAVQKTNINGRGDPLRLPRTTATGDLFSEKELTQRTEAQEPFSLMPADPIRPY
jgi:hypothetical protein